ncbi:hypothetical protein JCM15764A_33160 [Geotalea toluenoxydans]
MNSTYQYRIKSFDGVSYSAPSTATAAGTTDELPVPTNLTAAAVAYGQIHLSWTGSNGATTYFIYRKTGLLGSYAQIATVSSSSFIDNVAWGDMEASAYQARAFDGVNTTSPSNEATAPMILFSNVAGSSHTVETDLSQMSTIQFTIASPATVKMNIILQNQGVAGTPVYQASQTLPVAGTYTFTWDGKDSTGRVVPDEAYLYTLQATQGDLIGWYGPVEPQGGGAITCSQVGTYDAFQNKSQAVNYSVTQPSRVVMYVDHPQWGALHEGIAWFPALAGSGTYIWDGRDASGKVSAAGGIISCYILSPMSENVIITTGDTPKISDVKADPFRLSPAYGEVTHIRYTLSRDANVTISVRPNNAQTPIQLTPSPLAQTAGTHEFDWSCLNLSDSTGKSFSLSKDGYYTFTINAVNPVTGSQFTAYANIEVKY